MELKVMKKKMILMMKMGTVGLDWGMMIILEIC